MKSVDEYGGNFSKDSFRGIPKKQRNAQFLRRSSYMDDMRLYRYLHSIGAESPNVFEAYPFPDAESYRKCCSEFEKFEYSTGMRYYSDFVRSGSTLEDYYPDKSELPIHVCRQLIAFSRCCAYYDSFCQFNGIYQCYSGIEIFERSLTLGPDFNKHLDDLLTYSLRLKGLYHFVPDNIKNIDRINRVTGYQSVFPARCCYPWKLDDPMDIWFAFDPSKTNEKWTSKFRDKLDELLTKYPNSEPMPEFESISEELKRFTQKKSMSKKTVSHQKILDHSLYEYTSQGRYRYAGVQKNAYEFRSCGVADVKTVRTVQRMNKIVLHASMNIPGFDMNEQNLKKTQRERRKRNRYFMMPDLSKAGLTIPKELFKIIEETFIKHEICSKEDHVFDLCTNWTIEIEGVEYVPERGLPLGQANSIQTLIGCVLGELFRDELMKIGIEISHIGNYNDDMIYIFKELPDSEDICDAFADLVSGLGLLLSEKKMFASSGSVYLEDYYGFDNFECAKTMLEFFPLFSSIYCCNTTMAKAMQAGHYNAMVQTDLDLGSWFLAAKILSPILGYEYFLEEWMIDYKLGGWAPMHMSKDIYSELCSEIDSLHEDGVIIASIEVNTNILPKMKLRPWSKVTVDNVISKLEVEYKGYEHPMYSIESRVNDLLKESPGYTYMFRYWSELYKRRIGNFSKRTCKYNTDEIKEILALKGKIRDIHKLGWFELSYHPFLTMDKEINPFFRQKDRGSGMDAYWDAKSLVGTAILHKKSNIPYENIIYPFSPQEELTNVPQEVALFIDEDVFDASASIFGDPYSLIETIFVHTGMYPTKVLTDKIPEFESPLQEWGFKYIDSEGFPSSSFKGSLVPRTGFDRNVPALTRRRCKDIVFMNGETTHEHIESFIHMVNDLYREKEDDISLDLEKEVENIELSNPFIPDCDDDVSSQAESVALDNLLFVQSPYLSDELNELLKRINHRSSLDEVYELLMEEDDNSLFMKLCVFIENFDGDATLPDFLIYLRNQECNSEPDIPSDDEYFDDLEPSDSESSSIEE
jgi:hypothetical protein